MQAARNALVLVCALIAWPVLAQQPTSSAKQPAPSFVSTELPPIPPMDAGRDTAMPPPPESQPAMATPSGSILSMFPPLNVVREPGDLMVNFGQWINQNSGSSAKTGEYQGLASSPFWVVDGLFSNGYRTLGIYGNQTDGDSNQASLRYYQPGLWANVDYQRFIHNLGHEPLTNFNQNIAAGSLLPANTTVLGQDKNPTQDYAIRVEEFKASTGWKINDNLKVGVDVWEMHKYGERQENAAAHCFLASAQKGAVSQCHVLSQAQHIDWTTLEITSKVEAHYGPMTVEYSHRIQQFTDNDQSISRGYNNGNLTTPTFSGGMIWGNFPYADVPGNTTNTDQITASVDLGPKRRLYTHAFVGQTDDTERDTHRDFNGIDARLTDSTIDRTTVTVYTKTYNQTGSRPTFLTFTELQNLSGAQANAEIRTPIEYHDTTAGIKASWRPGFNSGLCKDLNISIGYEFDYLERVNAIWETPPESFPGTLAGASEKGVYQQGNTTTQAVFVEARKPWGNNVDTFVRFKVLFTDNVLYGFRELSDILNTTLPQTQNIVEFGGGWHPFNNFSITLDQNVTVGQTRTDNSAVTPGNVVDYHEQSYATTVTASYAPTSYLSLIGSVSIYSDWVKQNIFLGDNYDDGLGVATTNLPNVVQPTFYAGMSEQYNFNILYKLTCNTRLNFGFQYVHGNEQFFMDSNPSFFPRSLLFNNTNEIKNPTYGDLGIYSADIVDTTKLTAGITWRIRPRAVIGFHYDFFDYIDETNSNNSGIAHQFNMNLNLIW